MVLPHITLRLVAPYLLKGAYGAHILTRMWRLSQQPPSGGPLYIFLIENADVLLVLTGGPILWHLAQRYYERKTYGSSRIVETTPPITWQVAHQLRQVFTALLIGLGLIKRRIIRNQPNTILDVIERLQNVVAEGIQVVNVLDPPAPFRRNGSELELEG